MRISNNRDVLAALSQTPGQVDRCISLSAYYSLLPKLTATFEYRLGLGFIREGTLSENEDVAFGIAEQQRARISFGDVLRIKLGLLRGS